ncbi:attacin-B-like [Rhynchophorus ferrugineus]|uniref:attacin-B-like n=1 Tax=Rhynchophorus ferrugineus TaxID=354439 RepID=UPI003FCEAC77
MKAFSVVLFAFFVAIATAQQYATEAEESAYHQYSIAEDEEGQQYYLIPLSRSKRSEPEKKNTQPQTDWQIRDPGILTVSHKGTISNNENHRLEGMGYAQKNLRGHGIEPEVFGGGLKYTHIPSESNLKIGADHAPGFGTNLKASGTYNMYHSKNADVGLTGQYSRVIDTPYGNLKPNWGVFLGGQYRF